MAVPDRLKEPANLGWAAAAVVGLTLGAVWLRFLATGGSVDERTRDRLQPRSKA